MLANPLFAVLFIFTYLICKMATASARQHRQVPANEHSPPISPRDSEEMKVSSLVIYHSNVLCTSNMQLFQVISSSWSF